jgi:two-component sensor histidine kinase
MSAPLHPRQSERIAALKELRILDTPREGRYDKIAELAAQACRAPIAVINFIDEGRQWFKAEVGLGVRETPLETSICAHIILNPGLTIIRDTLADPRMATNPLCVSDPNLRFYAGVVLTEKGLPIGTLCVLDHQPRDLSEHERTLLSGLADQVVIQLGLGRQLRQAEALQAEVDHRVRNSLGQVQALLSLQARQSASEELKQALEDARDRVRAVATVHDQLHRTGSLVDVDLKPFIEQLVETYRSQIDDKITVRADVASRRVPANVASNIGIMINEFITNALRHGFNQEDTGTIVVSGAPVGDLEFRIAVTDDGKGLPADFDPSQTKGLGMRLAVMLAKQFSGDLFWTSNGCGTVFEFSVRQ